MEKFSRIIPKGIQYLSEINGFELPNGILNKEVTGCGATTIALTDKYPTIICSPRNKLLENKHFQYPGSFLLVGGVNPEQIEEYISKTDIPKILTSYDSFKKLQDILPNKTNWRVVVDEFHYVLSDASFKADIMYSFLEEVKKYPYVTYLSATPILEEFISKIDFFKNIPYYQLEWEEKEVVRVQEIPTNKPVNCICDMLKKFIANPPQIILDNGEILESKECVIFLNSVTDIVKIIKHLELSSNDTNIIVASSDENKTLISKLGQDYKLGYIPQKGEVHKKITFCTSTAYAGCDFYSECATTFVVSDCNRVNTAVDVTTDLVQIAGRQRLESNPFRKEIFFIYNIGYRLQSEKDFFEKIDRKRKYTEHLIKTNNEISEEDVRTSCIEELQRKPDSIKYSHSYLNYSQPTGRFIFNQLAYQNESYNYRVQMHNYKNGIIIRKQLEESGFSSIDKHKFMLYEEQIKQMFKRQSFVEKMKEYCNLKQEDNFLSKQKCRIMKEQHPELEYYYKELGISKIRALSYKEKQLKEEIQNRSFSSFIKNRLLTIIEIGSFISANQAKTLLNDLYKEQGITSIASGSDLDYWYNIESKVRSINGIKTKGYIIKNAKTEEGSNQ